MSIKFMLQPDHAAYWRAANADENTLLTSFCEFNQIKTANFNVDGHLPTMQFRGMANDLDKQPYIQIRNGVYNAYVDQDGSQWNAKQEKRASAQLFIQKGKESKMMARPYARRFIDPRCRDHDLFSMSIEY